MVVTLPAAWRYAPKERDVSMQPKTRLAIETALAAVFAAIFVATVFWPDWIELVFGADPDEGSGGFEWAIVAISGLLAIALIIIARMEWRRQHRADGVITSG
jgi:hypothetical protein